MNAKEMLDPECWAKRTFGPSKLKDIRRTGRAVKTAARMAENASASEPSQMQTWKDSMALYRLLNEDDVSFDALMQPHWDQTREQINTPSVVLLVQDTTEVDLSHHPKTKGLGQVGNERGRGLYIQTVLAILPEQGEVLGCAMQEPFVRTSAPAGETRSQRRQRTERETDVWMRLVTRVLATSLIRSLKSTDEGSSQDSSCYACGSSILSPSLQSRPGYPSHMSHYPKMYMWYNQLLSRLEDFLELG